MLTFWLISREFSGSLENMLVADMCTGSLNSHLKCVYMSSWCCDVGKIKLRFPQVFTFVVYNMPIRCICPSHGSGLNCMMGGGSTIHLPRRVALEVAWVWMQHLWQQLTDHRRSGRSLNDPDLPCGLGRLYLQTALKPSSAVLSVC